MPVIVIISGRQGLNGYLCLIKVSSNFFSSCSFAEIYECLTVDVKYNLIIRKKSGRLGGRFTGWRVFRKKF